MFDFCYQHHCSDHRNQGKLQYIATELQFQAEGAARRASICKRHKQAKLFHTIQQWFFVSSGFRISYTGEKRAITSRYRLIPWHLNPSSQQHYLQGQEVRNHKPYFRFIPINMGGTCTHQDNPGAISLCPHISLLALEQSWRSRSCHGHLMQVILTQHLTLLFNPLSITSQQEGLSP